MSIARFALTAIVIASASAELADGSAVGQFDPAIKVTHSIHGSALESCTPTFASRTCAERVDADFALTFCIASVDHMLERHYLRRLFGPGPPPPPLHCGHPLVRTVADLCSRLSTLEAGSTLCDQPGESPEAIWLHRRYGRNRVHSLRKLRVLCHGERTLLVACAPDLGPPGNIEF